MTLQSKLSGTANQSNVDESAISSLKIEWLNSVEAANHLKISVNTLMNLTSNGGVPHYKLGRRNRYRKDELDLLLLRNKRGKYGN